MKIFTKHQMFKLYENGAFGNKLRTWSNLKSFLSDEYSGFVSLRYKGAWGGGLAYYNVPSNKVVPFIEQLIRSGWDETLIAINESAPDNRLKIQGEVMRDERGLCLFWSDIKDKMRVALKHGVQTIGLKSNLILRQNLTPSSYDDVMELLDTYEDSVVEFSAYEMNLGTARGRNAIIWEVRNY